MKMFPDRRGTALLAGLITCLTMGVHGSDNNSSASSLNETWVTTSTSSNIQEVPLTPSDITASQIIDSSIITSDDAKSALSNSVPFFSASSDSFISSIKATPEITTLSSISDSHSLYTVSESPTLSASHSVYPISSLIMPDNSPINTDMPSTVSVSLMMSTHSFASSVVFDRSILTHIAESSSFTTAILDSSIMSSSVLDSSIVSSSVLDSSIVSSSALDSSIVSSSVLDSSIVSSSVLDSSFITTSVMNSSMASTQYFDSSAESSLVQTSSPMSSSVFDSSVISTPVLNSSVMSTPVFDNSIVSIPVFDSSIMTTSVLDGSVMYTTVLSSSLISSPFLDSSIMPTPFSDSLTMSSPLFDSSVMTTPVLDSSVMSTPVLDSSVMSFPLLDSTLIYSPVLDSSIMSGPVLDSSLMSTPVLDSSIMSSQVLDSTFISTPVFETSVMSTPVLDRSLMSTPVLDSSVMSFPFLDSTLISSPVLDGSMMSTSVLDSSIMSSPVLDSSLMSSPVLDSSLMSTPVLDSSVMSFPLLDSTLISSPVLDSSMMSTSVLDSSIMSSPVLDSSLMSTPVLDRSLMSTPVLDSSVMSFPLLDSTLISSPVLDSSMMSTSVLDSSIMSTPVLDSSLRSTQIFDSSATSPLDVSSFDAAFVTVGNSASMDYSSTILSSSLSSPTISLSGTVILPSPSETDMILSTTVTPSVETSTSPSTDLIMSSPLPSASAIPADSSWSVYITVSQTVTTPSSSATFEATSNEPFTSMISMETVTDTFSTTDDSLDVSTDITTTTDVSMESVTSADATIVSIETTVSLQRTTPEFTTIESFTTAPGTTQVETETVGFSISQMKTESTASSFQTTTNPASSSVLFTTGSPTYTFDTDNFTMDSSVTDPIETTTALSLNVSDALSQYWVKTVIEVPTDEEVNTVSFTESMETKLASLFNEAIKLDYDLMTGQYNPNGRSKRAVMIGNATVQVTRITRSPSQPTTTDIVYYLIENQGNVTSASRTEYLINLFSQQEVAIRLGYVVINQGQRFVPLPSEDKKLWIIGVVIGSVVGVIIIVWLALCIYIKCTRPPSLSPRSPRQKQAEAGLNAFSRDVKGFDYVRTEVGLHSDRQQKESEVTYHRYRSSSPELEGMYSPAPPSPAPKYPDNARNGKHTKDTASETSKGRTSKSNGLNKGYESYDETTDFNETVPLNSDSGGRSHLKKAKKKQNPDERARNSRPTKLPPLDLDSVREKSKHTGEDSKLAKPEKAKRKTGKMQGKSNPLMTTESEDQAPKRKKKKSKKLNKPSSQSQENIEMDKISKKQPAALIGPIPKIPQQTNENPEDLLESDDSLPEPLENARLRMHELLDEAFSLVTPLQPAVMSPKETSSDEKTVTETKPEPLVVNYSRRPQDYGHSLWNPHEASDEAAKILTEPIPPGSIATPKLNKRQAKSSWMSDKPTSSQTHHFQFSNPSYISENKAKSSTGDIKVRTPQEIRRTMVPDDYTSVVMDAKTLYGNNDYEELAPCKTAWGKSTKSANENTSQFPENFDEIPLDSPPQGDHRRRQDLKQSSADLLSRLSKGHADDDDDEVDVVSRVMKPGVASEPLVSSIRDELERLAYRSNEAAPGLAYSVRT